MVIFDDRQRPLRAIRRARVTSLTLLQSLFALGMVGVGFLAIPVMTTGAAYDLCQTSVGNMVCMQSRRKRKILRDHSHRDICGGCSEFLRNQPNEGWFGLALCKLY